MQQHKNFVCKIPQTDCRRPKKSKLLTSAVHTDGDGVLFCQHFAWGADQHSPSAVVLLRGSGQLDAAPAECFKHHNLSWGSYAAVDSICWPDLHVHWLVSYPFQMVDGIFPCSCKKTELKRNHSHH